MTQGGPHSMLALVAVLVVYSLPGLTSAQDPACAELGDLVIVLDSSRQVNQETWDAVIRLVQEISYRLTISYELTRVAVVVYGKTAQEVFPFNRYFTSEEVAMAVGKLTYQSSELANLTAALAFVESSVFLNEKGERSNAPNAAIFITASQPNVQREMVFLIASRLRRSGVRLFTVGIDGRVDRVELRAIATNPDETHFYYVRGPAEVSALSQPIVENVCRELQLCTEAADLVFILDTSGSVKEEWTRSLRFARNLVDLLPVGKHNVRVAAVAYSNYAYKQFDFDTDYTRDGLKRLINGIHYHEENTNTSGALRLTRTGIFKKEFGNREGVRDVGVLITDGKATWEAENLPYESMMTHRAGIQMYAIGLGTAVKSEELRIIASDPDIAHVYEVDKAEDYVNEAIILKWTDCEIDFTYCTKSIDLVFVLDQSGSIGESNFRRMLNFVRTLIGVLEINAGTARVGVVLIGDEAEIYFRLNSYELGEEAARAILAVDYGYGATDTAGALRLVRTDMFTPEGGDRPGAPNFVVVITDGASDDFAATALEARALKENGVTILALGISDPRWMRDIELRTMVSGPRDKNALQVRDFESLDQVVQALQDATCNETDECRDLPCQNGGVCTNGTNRYTCQCPEALAGKDCQYRCPNFYDVVFAIDASGSVGERSFYKMLDFFSNLVGDLPFPIDSPRTTQIGMLTYSDDVEIHQYLDTYSDAQLIQDTIYVPYAQGKTNTAAAIRTMREVMFTAERGDRPLVPNVGILITDGKSTDREATWREAIEARNKGIHLIVIGVTNSVSDLELRGIASGPESTNVIRVRDFDALSSITTDIVQTLCNAENECEMNQCQNDGTCLDGLGTYTCLCPTGFVGQYCQYKGTDQIDLAILLDSSGSIQRENFPRIISFAKAIVSSLPVSLDGSLVAAITFGTEAQVHFSLDDYLTTDDVIHALDMIRYRAGTTNLADALRMMRQEVFSGRGGDRLHVPNYSLILTDGDPDDLDAAVKEAVLSRIDGTHLLVVGLSFNDQLFLQYQAIASYPQERTVFSVRRMSQLVTLINNVTATIVDDRDYCEGVNCNGGQCIPQYLTFRCQCPVPLTGPLCTRRCNRQLDLALVVDVSADDNRDFPLMLAFLRGLIGGLSFQFGNTRVSLVCFDRSVKTLFRLSDYTSELEVLEAITLAKRGSGTDISSALYTIRDEIFKANVGDRKGVPNYVVLMSDGQSSGSPRVDLPDVVVYTVGIGRNVNRLVLNQVNARAQPIQEYQRIETAEDVPQVLDKVLDNLCA